MSLHGLGVIGAQVAASFKSNDDKHMTGPAALSPVHSVQSTPYLTEPPRVADFDPSIGAKPCSPFYPHGTPSLSCEHLTYETKLAEQNRHQLGDLENAGPYLIRGGSPQRSKLWEERKPSRSCLHSLTGRQRLLIKAIIAVVTIGGMIGIALGITVAVGGTAWRSGGDQPSLGG
ncbi:hypothetical protein N7470_004651 [Penicillium chermesinum]|nr:hypothetical protein N7470_004651 [Penicillium chermesinum]